MTNKVILAGRLGRDPELRSTGEGDSMAQMSIATTREVKGKEYTDWHRVVAWGDTAELCREFSKGDPIRIEGRLRTRKFADKTTGKDRHITEVIAEVVNGKTGGKTADSRPARVARTSKNDAADFDDDLPF